MLTLGEKSLAAPGNWICLSGVAVRRYQLSYIPAPFTIAKHRFAAANIHTLQRQLYFCSCKHERQFPRGKNQLCGGKSAFHFFRATNMCSRKTARLRLWRHRSFCSCKCAPSICSCKNEKRFCHYKVGFVAAKLRLVFKIIKVKLSPQNASFQLHICAFSCKRVRRVLF